MPAADGNPETGFHGQGKSSWETEAMDEWEVKLTLNCSQRAAVK